MNRLSMLATSDGEWVIEDSAEFRAAAGDSEPDYDASAFAVKNLGFIKFQILDDSIIEIELHPRNVELPAVLTVQQQILSSPIKLFRIKYLDTIWHSEITASPQSAISRLAELCAPTSAPPPSQKFLVEPRDYTQLFQDEGNPLRLMAQKWRMSFGYFDGSVISFAIEHQLLSRLMIFGVKPAASDPIFRFIGDGFPWLENDYHLVAIGDRVQNQPDKEYGSWVSEFYKNVATTGQPRYDHITAGIRQTLGEQTLFVSSYERLLLPWKTPSDEVLVSMLSRALGEQKTADSSALGPSSPVIRISAKSS